MINYFKEYHFSRDVQTQKMFIKHRLKSDQNLLESYKEEIAMHTFKLQALIKEAKTDEAEQVQQKLKEYRKKVIELENEISEIEAIFPIPEDTQDSPIKEDQIGNLYFSIKLKIMTASLENEWNKLRSMVISKEPVSEERIIKTNELREKVTKLLKMRYVLCNAERRREYLSRIERQEYVQVLEENKNGRMDQEKRYIRSVLGDEFNPNMSSYKDKGKSFRWRVKLYDRPERLFVGKSNYPNAPQINQSIQAYRYGIFEYDYMLNQNGESSYSDSLCEVIGVTKRAMDGTETTSFLIAPLRYFSGLKDVTLDQNGRIVKSSEIRKIHDMNSSRTKKSKGLLGNILSTLSSEKQNVGQTRHKARKQEQRNYKRTLVVKAQKYEVKDEERDFFANVYLSDYLIDNAIKNNAHYLGSYTFKDDTRKVVFDAPMEDSRVEACSFAKKNKGILIKRTSSGISKSEMNNIDELFEFLGVAQHYLSYEESKTLRKSREREF